MNTEPLQMDTVGFVTAGAASAQRANRGEPPAKKQKMVAVVNKRTKNKKVTVIRRSEFDPEVEKHTITFQLQMDQPFTLTSRPSHNDYLAFLGLQLVLEPEPFEFMALHPELRVQFYEHVFADQACSCYYDPGRLLYRQNHAPVCLGCKERLLQPISLLLTSKQVYKEAAPVFHSAHHFAFAGMSVTRRFTTRIGDLVGKLRKVTILKADTGAQSTKTGVFRLLVAAKNLELLEMHGTWGHNPLPLVAGADGAAIKPFLLAMVEAKRGNREAVIKMLVFRESTRFGYSTDLAAPVMDTLRKGMRELLITEEPTD